MFNSVEGTFYFEGSALANDSSNRRLSLSDGTGNNRVTINYSSSNNIQIYFINPIRPNFTPTFAIDITQNAKIAISWSSSKVNFYVNGSLVAEDLANSSFPINTLDIVKFKDGGGGLDWYANTKALQVFNTQLTGTELEELTSYTSFNAMATSLNYTII